MWLLRDMCCTWRGCYHGDVQGTIFVLGELATMGMYKVHILYLVRLLPLGCTKYNCCTWRGCYHGDALHASIPKFPAILGRKDELLDGHTGWEYKAGITMNIPCCLYIWVNWINKFKISYSGPKIVRIFHVFVCPSGLLYHHLIQKQCEMDTFIQDE